MYNSRLIRITALTQISHRPSALYCVLKTSLTEATLRKLNPALPVRETKSEAKGGGDAARP
jgi:hypothetical protein